LTKSSPISFSPVVPRKYAARFHDGLPSRSPTAEGSGKVPDAYRAFARCFYPHNHVPHHRQCPPYREPGSSYPCFRQLGSRHPGLSKLASLRPIVQCPPGRSTVRHTSSRSNGGARPAPPRRRPQRISEMRDRRQETEARDRRQAEWPRQADQPRDAATRAYEDQDGRQPPA
jgi:hypothetical protein